MYNFWIFIFSTVSESWFLQGIIINTAFALCSMPFTNKVVQKTFKNRKINRVKNACNELNTYCIQQIIRDKHIDKDNFENQIYIIASKYKLEVNDIYNDKNIFGQNLTRIILKLTFIDDNTKEKIISKIRKDKLFIESDNEHKITSIYDSIIDEESDYSDEYNKKDDIQLNKDDKKYIHKYTGIITGIIFISLLLYTFLCQILIKAYGMDSVVFINAIIIVMATIPILINGSMHFSEFNEQNKIYFGFLVLISLLNFINFICIIGILF